MKIQFRKLVSHAQIPTKANSDDAAYDLTAVDYAYNLGVRCVVIFCPDKKIIYTSEMRYLRKMYAAGSFGIIYYRLGVKKWVQYKVKEGIRLGFVRYSDGKIGNILQNLNQPPDKGEEMNEQALQLSMFGNE